MGWAASPEEYRSIITGACHRKGAKYDELLASSQTLLLLTQSTVLWSARTASLLNVKHSTFVFSSL